jgi:hypothetical protein
MKIGFIKAKIPKMGRIDARDVLTGSQSEVKTQEK